MTLFECLQTLVCFQTKQWQVEGFFLTTPWCWLPQEQQWVFFTLVQILLTLQKCFTFFFCTAKMFLTLPIFLDWSEYFCTANIVFGCPKYTCFVIRHCGKQIAKDSLLIRQQQACSRITQLVIDCPIVITSIGMIMPRNETRNAE